MIVRFCFDTSALNQLHDDVARDALITALLAGGPFWITSYNVLEAAKTKDVGRRHSLVRMMRRLADGKPPLSRPNTLVRAIARAYFEAGLNGEPRFAANNDRELEGLWVALKEPELLDEEIRDEAQAWASEWEANYDAIASGARDRFQSVFANSPKDRPHTAAVTLRGFMRNDDKMFSRLVAPIYEQETGKPLSRAEYDRMMEEPTWALYLGGYGYALHHRSVKTLRFGKTNNAGGIDLGQAVYLRFCERFVTHDRPQYRALRFLNRFSRAAKYEAEVLTYEAFRRRLLPFG